MNLDGDSNRSPSILFIVVIFPPLDDHLCSTKAPKGPGSSLLARATRPTIEAVRKEMETGPKDKRSKDPKQPHYGPKHLHSTNMDKVPCNKIRENLTVWSGFSKHA